MNEVKIFLQQDRDDNFVSSFTGHGCAISIAATSLLLELLQNKNKQQILTVIEEFRAMLKNEIEPDANILGKLVVFSGVKRYPSRIKCATLGCHALKLAVNKEKVDIATTEV